MARRSRDVRAIMLTAMAGRGTIFVVVLGVLTMISAITGALLRADRQAVDPADKPPRKALPASRVGEADCNPLRASTAPRSASWHGASSVD